MAFRVSQIPYDPTNDYYDLLGISFGATADEIQKAFRKQAKIRHPDHNMDQPEQATAEFQVISEAYAVLSDPTLRKAYDRKRWLHVRQTTLSTAYPHNYPQPSPTDLADESVAPAVQQEANQGVARKPVRKVRRKARRNPNGILFVVLMIIVAVMVVSIPIMVGRSEAILPTAVPYTAPIATVSAGCPDPAAQFSRLSDGDTVRLPTSIELYAGGPHRIDYRLAAEQAWTTVYESDTWGRHYVRLSIPAGEIVLRLTVEVIDGDQPVSLICERSLTVLRIDSD